MVEWVDGMNRAGAYVNNPIPKVSAEEQELARRFMIKHGAEDLIGMLGL
jgi:hypothetical protein